MDVTPTPPPMKISAFRFQLANPILPKTEICSDTVERKYY
jgi:hypothetical protein